MKYISGSKGRRIVSKSYHFLFKTQLFSLVDQRFVGIKRHVCDDTKELREPCRIGVILQSQARIHKDRSLIWFDEQANHACLHFVKAGIAGESIEDVEVHNFTIA